MQHVINGSIHTLAQHIAATDDCSCGGNCGGRTRIDGVCIDGVRIDGILAVLSAHLNTPISYHEMSIEA
ncbi:uncharacterized protein YALI1_F15047g [Yarrowia lipolytica]|uniref:Uncharacterized protein n=1 Tax=Yarrowia lipolytica TaxID=4952 RepID=A0A1D8NN01_YARLL|nr:hypothetical protein YALI1_F15047g [Yarrowia lipolytica]